MTAACNFISLGEKMRELLDKNGERKKKEKRKITDLRWPTPAMTKLFLS